MKNNQKISRLSDVLQNKNSLSSIEIVSVLREIVARLEITGLDRRDDLFDMASGLCTCPPNTKVHLDICPQARKVEQ